MDSKQLNQHFQDYLKSGAARTKAQRGERFATLFAHSEVKLDSAKGRIKIPSMGWCTVPGLNETPQFDWVAVSSMNKTEWELGFGNGNPFDPQNPDAQDLPHTNGELRAIPFNSIRALIQGRF